MHIKILSNRADQNGFPCGQTVAEEQCCAVAIIFSIPKYIDDLQMKTSLFLNGAHGSQLIRTEMTKYQHCVNQAIDISWRDLNFNPPFPVDHFQSSDAQSSHFKVHSCIPTASGILLPHLSHFQHPGWSTEGQLGYLYIDFTLLSIFSTFNSFHFNFFFKTPERQTSKMWNFQSYWRRRKDGEREGEESLIFLWVGRIKLLPRLYITYSLTIVNTAALMLIGVYITVGRDIQTKQHVKTIPCIDFIIYAIQIFLWLINPSVLHYKAYWIHFE